MSPYKLSGTTVVSFSGGRTSAYMLRQVLDNNEDLTDLVVTFANTGKEHPYTLEFVRECAERWAVPIVWLEFRDDDAGFTEVDYATASRQPPGRTIRSPGPQTEVPAKPGNQVLHHRPQDQDHSQIPPQPGPFDRGCTGGHDDWHPRR